MAIIRQNLELMSPEESDAEDGRQNKITFLGFKSGDADFNDVTSGVGPTTHYKTGGGGGEGLNDVTIGGTYTGSSSIVYHVKITSTGTPDAFQYSADNASTWNGVNIDVVNSNGSQALSQGVTVFFEATTGHTSGDYWTSSVNQVVGTLTTPLKMAEIEVNHEGTSADNKARMIIRTNEGGTVGSTSIFTNTSGACVVGDMVSGGTYTGGPTPITYYVKVTDHSSTPNKFAWSTDYQHYSADINMTGSAQTLEKGVTVNWDSTTIGRATGDIYKFTVGADTIQLHANADFQCAGHVVSENGFLPKIFDSSGTQLNTYS
jgi:hypothetical protein